MIQNNPTTKSTIQNVNIIKIKFVKYICICLLFIMLPFSLVKAATVLNLYYDKQTVAYTGKQVIYTLDGKQISKKSYPGIIIGDTSLVSCKDVFIDSGMGITYSYSSAKGILILKKDYTTVKLTLNSKVAYIDNKKYSISQAPRKVTYKSTGVTKILVPARFIAEAFGYTYTWNSSISKANLSSPTKEPLNLFNFNTRKWFTYRGVQASVSINGSKVDVSKMPGIILDNVTMQQARKVFYSSGIATVYNYNKDKKTVTLENDKNKVVLTIGSKVAVVNGVSKTMPIETIIVKNATNGSSYIMVPASYVASYLGYSYTWNSTSRTSVLSKKVVDTTPDEGTIPPSDAEMTYNEYCILGNYLSTYTQLKTTAQVKSINNNTNSSANIGDVTRSTEVYEDREVFYVKAYSSFSTLTSDYSANNAIVLNIPSSFASNKTYIFADSIIQSAAVTYDEATKNSKITFTTSVKQPRYDLELVDGGYTIKVTIYYNYINALKLYYDNYTDYATFDTLYPSTLNVSSDETNIYIDLPYTVNSLGTINSTINEGYCIKAVTASQMPNRTTRITITKTKTSAYYSNASGNTVTFNLLYDDETSSTDMKIEIPANVDYSVIDTEDLYMQKQFKIIIPGNYVSFYKEKPVTSYSSMISNIKVSLNSTNCTEILVTTIALQGFRLTNNKTYIGVEVGDPQDIYSNIVVLDAGHGGSDKGAINYAAGIYEKNITLPIAYTYAKDYFNSKDSNIKVYWTRTNDTFITLDDRAAFAKKVGADLFISVHMNSVDSTTVKGSEVFYSTMNNTIQDSGISSKVMAQSYLNEIISNLNFVNRGVKTANYYVLKNNSVPSVLIEFGFISNATDLSKLKNPSFQKEAAKLLYNVTNDLFLKYPSGR